MVSYSHQGTTPGGKVSEEKTAGKTLQMRADAEYAAKVRTLAFVKETSESAIVREATDRVMMEADVDELIAQVRQRCEQQVAELEEFRVWQQTFIAERRAS